MIGAFVFGTPHILTTYDCSGSCRSSSAREYNCHYVGITGGKHAAPVNDKCPGIRLL